jgi:hypothetical protein
MAAGYVFHGKECPQLKPCRLSIDHDKLDEGSKVTHQTSQVLLYSQCIYQLSMPDGSTPTVIIALHIDGRVPLSLSNVLVQTPPLKGSFLCPFTMPHCSPIVVWRSINHVNYLSIGKQAQPNHIGCWSQSTNAPPRISKKTRLKRVHFFALTKPKPKNRPFYA